MPLAAKGNFWSLLLAFTFRYIDKAKKIAMKLSQQSINEFKRIYEEEQGSKLTDSEAEEMAMRLLRVFDILRMPVGKLTDLDGTLP